MKRSIPATLKIRDKNFTKSDQRAELLTRNEMFIDEYEKVIEIIKNLFKAKVTSEKELLQFRDKIIKTFDYYTKLPDGLFTASFSFESSPEKLKKIYENAKLKALIQLWNRFCARWHINPRWNANLKSINMYQGPLAKMYIITLKDYPLPIQINIGPWTSLEDIKKIWSQVEKVQKRVFYKEEKSSNFARDICWYDLKKNSGLSPRQIANLWVDKFPEDIDLLVIKKIKPEIKKEDLLGRALNDSELIEEIKSGYLQENYKKDFEEEREWYITGQDVRRKSSPLFIDVIKKAIKRVEKRVEVLNLFSEPESVPIIDRFPIPSITQKEIDKLIKLSNSNINRSGEK